MTWTRSREEFLDGTYLAICPEYRSPYWFGYDTRDERVRLFGPNEKRRVKQACERAAGRYAVPAVKDSP